MLADNNTPFAAIGFEHRHRSGTNMVVISVRGTFDLTIDGKLQLAERQALVLSDVFDGRPHTTPLIRASDLIPFKPFADVTVLADAHAPNSKPARNWNVGIAVGQIKHTLRVHAPRAWAWDRDGWVGGWRLKYIEKGTTRTPIDYRFAFGGLLNGDPQGKEDQRNPIGRGAMAKGISIKRDEMFPAAQIECPKTPLSDPHQELEPEGFGPVPPWSKWRLRYVGTCDDQWQKMLAPRPPHDFQYQFHQVAHPKLILPSYLIADDAIELVGLTPGGGKLVFKLPDITPWASFDFIDGRQVRARLHCDGLHIDLRQGPPWRVDLTWRAWMPSCPQFWKINLHQSTFAKAAHLPHSDEEGLREAQS